MSKQLNHLTPTRGNSSSDDRSAAAEHFAAGADLHHSPASRKARPAFKAGELDFLTLPHDREWNIVNVRLTDREKEALKWLSDNSPDSMHTICKRVVKDEINRLLREKGIKEIGPVEK
ncbi:hypothetical protein AB3X94_37135 [Paraburkholderia sp. BR10923]|uniref:hypothetical protein n=1 Tax=Paraburkholderia sp. BR10923 TaxID=3236992 RepID=UPI0034CE63E6